ncbi:hypothetical protein WwSim0760, partial [Wolbachia endosymbiont of Drosophila simulans]
MPFLKCSISLLRLLYCAFLLQLQHLVFLQHMRYFLLSSAFLLLIPPLFHPIILILMPFKPRYFTYFSMAFFLLLSIRYLCSGNWYDDEIEDFLLRIRFVVNQPNHSKLDDIIKKEIGNIYKISGKKDIDMVFDFACGKVEKWWEQQGSEVSYLTRKDDYFKEAIEHLYSLKPRENLFERWNIPPKIAGRNFIERKYLNEKILDYLKTENEPVILTALQGLGGVGKTQSVLDFIQ